MNIYEKLMNIQNELKAPKNQYNSFGKYKYRSCEDILEAVKPINKKYNAVLVIKDEIQQIGDRYYVKATAILADTEKPGESIISSAYARENDAKTGMDTSQLTGATSSYARKYCLNGLFNIDDTKDADTEAFTKQSAPKKTTQAQASAAAELESIMATIKDTNGNALNVVSYLFKKFEKTSVQDLTAEEIAEAKKELTAYKERSKNE